ncbi:MAG TPA: hypothetical protein VEL70_00205 [Candidatus Acidoferrum sp.]|nr:hypothetical protein [Candidatus Acidoferrum sp.]
MGDYFNYYSASRQTVIYQIIAANWYFMTRKHGQLHKYLGLGSEATEIERRCDGIPKQLGNSKKNLA